MTKIPFNKPYFSGNELNYIKHAIDSCKISGGGEFTKKCQCYFEKKYGFQKTLLTTSCTDALEMCAMLADIKEGDEVIMPSYTFVSTALAFVRQGANIIFVDSREDHPGMNENSIRQLITSKTRAIVPVHYAGVACDMDLILGVSNEYNILVIEDAAQAIDSYYKGTPLGGIGDLSAFSFHETKNISSGEGGLLTINNEKFNKRGEIIWEKGTNRAEFFRGEVNKYGWVDIGSSFLPSEIISAYLYAQLENLERIQKKRKLLWSIYYSELEKLKIEGKVRLPIIPAYATNNAHMFYIVLNSMEERTNLINLLKKNSVLAVSHYLSLHDSKYYQNKYNGPDLPNAKKYTNRLLRLPLYFELKERDVLYICSLVKKLFK